MKPVYVAIGHGTEPNGVFDPGAVAADGTTEHELAAAVVASAGEALARSGVATVVEYSGGAGHDPDYRGSAAAVNAGDYACAVEVHFDWTGGYDGGSGLYVSDAGKALAAEIASAYGDSLVCPRPASNVRRADLYFLNATDCPAVIWECRRVGAYPPEQLRLMGGAIALGICRWLGVRFFGSLEAPVQSVVINYVTSIDCPTGGAWGLGADGGVFAFGSAPFKGSYPELPADDRKGGARTFDKIRPNDRGGYDIGDTAGEWYSFPLG